MGVHSEMALDALERIWPSLSEEGRASAIMELRRYGRLRAPRVIAWALRALESPDSSWSDALLGSLDLEGVSRSVLPAAGKLQGDLRSKSVNKPPGEVPTLVTSTDVMPLLADNTSEDYGWQIVARLPDSEAAGLELAPPDLSHWATLSLQRRLALARSSKAFKGKALKELWLLGLSDASDAVRLATILEISNRCELSKLDISPEDQSTAATALQPLLEPGVNADLRIPAIHAYACTAPRDNALVRVLTQLVPEDADDDNITIAVVLELKQMPGGRTALKELWPLTHSHLVHLYIAQALEEPGTSYLNPPEFSGFDQNFPRMPWPPGRFTDRLTLRAC